MIFASSDGNGVFAYLIVIAFMVWGVKKFYGKVDNDGSVKDGFKNGILRVLERKLK